MFDRLIKPVLFLLWVILIGALIRRDILIPEARTDVAVQLQLARQENYYGVWFRNKRIGYVVERMLPHPDIKDFYQIEQEALINLNVLDTVQPINMQLNGMLTPSMQLQDFSFSFSSSFYQMHATGKVSGNRVEFTLDTGQAVIEDSVLFESSPMLSLNQRPWLLSQLPEIGDKRKVPFFDPLSLEPRTSTIEYLGAGKELILGRVHTLRHYRESFSGIKTDFYTDDRGKIVKETTPAGFVLLAEPKFKATDITKTGDELLQAVAVPYSGSLPNKDSSAVHYRLTLPEGVQFDLDGGRQQLKGNILTVGKETFPQQTTGAPPTQCNGSDSLRASRYIQADHPLIRETAAEIVGPETDPARQVRLLAQYVYNTLEKRPVLGLPDALTSLRAKKGDCNEHAALFAALARSLGIPTEIATGVTLYRNQFYYHAWNEVCLQGNWYSLDTTTNQLPADLLHIRFGRGDMEEQLKVGSLLGKLGLEILSEDELSEDE